MRITTLFVTGCVSVLMAGLPALAATGIAPMECPMGKATAASYTWNFNKEANTLFQQMQTEALQAKEHANQLDGFARAGEVSWQAYITPLAQLKREVNDMSTKLCRLETIRSAVAPWQQHEIDQMSRKVRLLADNTADEIAFVNNNQIRLWRPANYMYTTNLYNLSNQMVKSTDHAVQYADAQSHYNQLRREIDRPAS